MTDSGEMKNAIIVMLGIACWLFLIHVRNEYDRREYTKKLKAEEYSGVVDSVFLDPESRMQPRAAIRFGPNAFVDNDIYKNILPGDVLFKKSGSLKHFLIHEGDTTTYYNKYDGIEVR